MPSPSTRHGGIWQSPWFWTGAGVASTAVAAVWLGLAGDTLETLRLGLVWTGLLLAGGGAALQFKQQAPRWQAHAGRRVQPLLIFVFAAMAVGVTVNCIASWAGVYFTGLRPGLATILWLLAGPMSGLAAWQSLQHFRARTPWRTNDESALSLLLTSATAFMACFALSSTEPDFVGSWFTMQRFLFIMGALALFCTPLIAVDVATRRWVISGLAVFHLAGIMMAALSHEPAPWVVNQILGRIYRPYLQFLYLTNAYHFYSPEPGPPSHVWFYLYFDNAQGEHLGHWYKIPKLDDSGRHGHTTSLEYQRYLSVTEHTMGSSPYHFESADYQKRAALRTAWTPEAAKNEPLVILNPTKREVLVPLHPTKTKSQQFHYPRWDNKKVLESYSRHVLHKHAAEHPDRKYTTVRIYRVVHRIPPTDLYFDGWHPTDPEFYTPIYMGEFDQRGRLLDPNDPYLYWELPILRDDPGVEESNIRDWARRHAGDPYWVRTSNQGKLVQWVDENGKPPPH